MNGLRTGCLNRLLDRKVEGTEEMHTNPLPYILSKKSLHEITSMPCMTDDGQKNQNYIQYKVSYSPMCLAEGDAWNKEETFRRRDNGNIILQRCF